MENCNFIHSQCPFQSRDLVCLFYNHRFDITPRNLHPACQGMGYIEMFLAALPAKAVDGIY